MRSEGRPSPVLVEKKRQPAVPAEVVFATRVEVGLDSDPLPVTPGQIVDSVADCGEANKAVSCGYEVDVDATAQISHGTEVYVRCAHGADGVADLVGEAALVRAQSSALAPEVFKRQRFSGRRSPSRQCAGGMCPPAESSWMPKNLRCLRLPPRPAH